MSGKPTRSDPAAGAISAGQVHPLRAISFGNPDVTIERRDDGTIYLRPKLPLGDYPVRLTDRLHHWAGTEPNRVFMAERDRDQGQGEGQGEGQGGSGGWRQITYAAIAGVCAPHRIGIAGARPFGGTAGRHPLRQFDRPCVDRVRRAVCRHSVLSGVAGLFAGVAGLRQAPLPDAAADPRAGLCRRRRHIRRCLGRQCS